MQDEENKENYFISTEGTIWRSMNNCVSFEKIFPITLEHKKVFNRDPHQHFSSLVLYKDDLYINGDYTHKWDGVKDNVYYPELIKLQHIYEHEISAISLYDEIERLVRNAAKKECLGTKITKCAANQNILHIYKTYMNTPEKITLLEYNMKDNIFENVVQPQIGSENFKAINEAGLFCNKKNIAIHYLSGWTFHQSKDSSITFQSAYNYSYGENNIPHTDIRSAQICNSSADGNSDHILLGTDGGLSYSSNGGKSYRNLNGALLPITQLYGVGVSGFDGKISVGAQDNSIMSYLPTSKKWIVSINGDGYDVEYTAHKKDLAYGEYNYQIVQSTNNALLLLIIL